MSKSTISRLRNLVGSRQKPPKDAHKKRFRANPLHNQTPSQTMPPYHPEGEADVYICIDDDTSDQRSESLKSLNTSTDSLLDFLHNSSNHSTPLDRKPLHEIEEKKSVRFADDLEHAVPTICRSDLSREEMESYWLTRMELWEIQSDKDRVVEMIDYGLQKEKGTTYRGLEIHTCGGIFRNKIKQQHAEAVLGTQMELRKLSASACCEQLARSCEETSEESSRLARQYGLKDQKDARKILSPASFL